MRQSAMEAHSERVSATRSELLIRSSVFLVISTLARSTSSAVAGSLTAASSAPSSASRAGPSGSSLRTCTVASSAPGSRSRYAKAKALAAFLGTTSAW